MRRFSSILLGSLLLGLLATAVLAGISPRLHDRVMQQIAASGVAQPQDNRYQAGLFSSEHSGELHFARSYCAGCEVMQYHGQSFHGLGTLLHGQPALAKLQYGLSWPSLPLSPGLPPLQLKATQGFDPQLQAQIQMTGGQHRWTEGSQTWQLEHQGLAGQLKDGRLQLELPRLSLQKARSHWLQLSDTVLYATAAEALRVSGETAQIVLPQWSWAGEKVQLDYQQKGSREKLNASVRIHTARSQLGRRSIDASNGHLQFQDVNLDASLAFSEQLPRLFSPQVSGAARMLGLFSLYSVHGPAFFATKPAVQLHAQNLPLADGSAQVDIALHVTENTHSPPMHPQQWRQALRGQVKIIAPKSQLSAGWRWAAPLVSFITGLPGSVDAMYQQGWMRDLNASHAELAFELDPLRGPVPLSTSTAAQSAASPAPDA